MDCKCGHMMSIHDEGGCQHADRTKGGIDLVCRCGLSPDAIAEAKLSALREAGEKMAERLRENRSASAMANSTIQKVLLFSQKDATALAEWEAANK